MRAVSQRYREAIEAHRVRGYRDSVFARITIGQYVFNSDQIIKMTHRRSSHPLSMNLPIASLNFTLDNENHTFDPDSGNPIVSYLADGTEIILEYGLELDAKTKETEWFIGGYFYLKSWDVKGNQATFNSEDIFKRLSTTIYKKGVFDHSAHTVQELAIAVLNDAGVTNYRIAGIHTYATYTYWPLPYTSHAECLQLLANLASSTLELDPDGAIVLRQRAEIPPENWIVYTAPRNPAPPVLPGTDVSSIALPTPKYNYAAWEDSYFALDGKMRLYPRTGPYLPVGVDFDVLPVDRSGRLMYSYQGFALGVFIDFTRARTFGSLEVEFPEYSRVTTIRIIAYISGAGIAFDEMFPVTGSIFTLSREFKDIVWVNVLPTYTSKSQRCRIRNVRIDNAVWPLLSYDDVLGSVKKEQTPSCSRVDYRYLVSTFWVSHTEELMRVDVIPGELTEITHSELYYNQSFSSENPNVVFEYQEFYAYTAFVRISGVTENTEIILNGATIASSTPYYATTLLGANGEETVIENEISVYESSARLASEWMASYYKNIVSYEIPTLGYPESDSNDQMRFEGKRAVILENTITLNQGSMKGTIKARGEG